MLACLIYLFILGRKRVIQVFVSEKSWNQTFMMYVLFCKFILSYSFFKMCKIKTNWNWSEHFLLKNLYEMVSHGWKCRWLDAFSCIFICCRLSSSASSSRKHPRFPPSELTNSFPLLPSHFSPVFSTSLPQIRDLWDFFFFLMNMKTSGNIPVLFIFIFGNL